MSTEAQSRQGLETSEIVGDSLAVGTQLLRGQFRIEKFLNAGGFGMTYLARNSLDRLVVIKECFPSFLCYRTGQDVTVRSKSHSQNYRALVDLFRAEARALAGLDHPNIVGVHEVFDDNNTSYMALDFVEGKDLQEIIESEPERLSPYELRQVLVSVLGAVSYIHERGVLHRDISPDNILLDRHNVPILIDFGSARASSDRINGAETRLQSVKDGYSPHEFYARKLPHSAASDLYALGATFHFAIRGEAPPPSQYRLATVIESKKDPYLPLKGQVTRFDKRVLESIDRSLAIVAKDRPQSAREWLLAIDDDSRKVAALEKARNDERIEQIVRDLVFETNTALKEIQEQEKKAQAIEAKESAARAKAARREAKLRDSLGNPVGADLGATDGQIDRLTDLQPVTTVVPKRVEVTASKRARADGTVDDQESPWVSGSQRSSVPEVQRSASDKSDGIRSAEPGSATSRGKRPRGLLRVNWVLPPLYVSNAAQLAGKVE